MANVGQIAKNMWTGSFEAMERDFAVNGIKKGMRVLNIGANSGLYTIIASKMVGPSGEVHAFEPSSKTFELLQKNIELNDCRNVILNKLALSDFSGKLALNKDPSHPDMDGHFFVSQMPETSSLSSGVIEEIPCATLDEYWRELCRGKIQSVDFLVIDVEGAEFSVFNGAKRTIAASPNLVMIMECTTQLDEIRKLLSDFGFKYYLWDVDSRSLIQSELGRGGFIARREM
jgi:FkbM family methyltransferase